MSSGRRPSRPAPTPDGDLLREAACSYVEAYGAIITLHEIARDRARAAVLRRLDEYTGALGVPLEAGRVLPYQGPKPADWDGTWASLGCQVKKLGPPRCWLYHTLDWEPDGAGGWRVAVNASFWFRAADEAARMHAALMARASALRDGVALWFEGSEVGAARPLAPADTPAFDVHLDALLGQWLDLLRAVGGLGAMSATEPRAGSQQAGRRRAR